MGNISPSTLYLLQALFCSYGSIARLLVYECMYFNFLFAIVFAVSGEFYASRLWHQFSTHLLLLVVGFCKLYVKFGIVCTCLSLREVCVRPILCGILILVYLCRFLAYRLHSSGVMDCIFLCSLYGIVKHCILY